MLFGDVRISSTELARLVCRNVRSMMETHPSPASDTVWTKAVKQVLHEAGSRLGYDICCHGVQDCHEWLLDVVWWKTPTDTGGIGMALAVESEWGDSVQGVLDDFRKLLCVKAPLKLMIYDGGDLPECGTAVQSGLKADLHSYHHHIAGEVYLFMGFGPTKEYCHRFVVPNDGILKNIEFELLETSSMSAGA